MELLGIDKTNLSRPNLSDGYVMVRVALRGETSASMLRDTQNDAIGGLTNEFRTDGWKIRGAGGRIGRLGESA